MSDNPTPDLLDLMAEAMTTHFAGHPQRRHQALAANRVIAERMWPPVQAAVDERDAVIRQLTEGNIKLADTLAKTREALQHALVEEQELAEATVARLEAENLQLRKELDR
jgi:hypothetical protein